MFAIAPLLSVFARVVYFRKSDPSQPLKRRLLASAHGVVMAVIYFGALTVFWSHHARDSFARPFALTLFIPPALILLSFAIYRGPRAVHLLQLVNIFALALTFLIGGMAVTGDWRN